MGEKRPIIGISGSILVDQGGIFPGYERAYVNNNYIQAVVNAGGVPFMVPIINNPDIICQQVEQIDGLVVSGGHDVNPLLYGEEPRELLGAIFPERDSFDELLIKATIEAKKPVLAICRGFQILNVIYAGTLYQDISYNDDSYIKHMQADGPAIATHTIKIEKDSLLGRIFGEQSITNSFHHQSIKEIAPGFRVTAIAKDGTIEAIEKEDAEFVLGVQFHPEMMAEKHENMLNLFRAMIKQATNKKLQLI